jgi:Glycosyl hydrolase catalytic core
MITPTLLVLLSLAGLENAPGPRFEPPTLAKLYTDPGGEPTLQLRLAAGDAVDPVAYRVLDYAGSLVTRGQLRPDGVDHWELSLNAVQGFLEIELPSSGQRFGVVCLPAWKGKPDAFFAIDGGLSWLVPESTRREQLIEAARRCGVSLIRERLSWSAVSPDRDHWNLDGSARYDSLRRFYRASGMPILELAHDSPRWLGHVGKYPRDLIGTAQSWAELGRKWATSWGGVELWNEPDIDFGGNLPADQYVAIAKAISFGLAHAGIRAPMVGGAMAYPNRDFLETCASSGLLDRIDAFSFHTYGKAEGMQATVEGYRDWLIKSGHGAMPIWITECGRPWSRGPDRPPVAEDQTSALDIVMKGVEARACGVARYFPFVYPFYNENNSNFGMTDRRGTPLRSYAAYAQMIRVLANQRYLGDLRQKGPGISRARVFGDDHQAIAVLYSGGKPASAVAQFGLRCRRIEGIDGRALTARNDGSIPIPDGLTYAWIDHPLDPRLIDRSATALARPSTGPGEAARPAPSPIVLRLRLDEARFQPSARGYRMKGEPGAPLPLTFEVWNLGDQSCTPKLELTLDSPGVRLAQPERSITLAGRSSGLVEWTIDVASMFARQGRRMVRLSAREEAGPLDKLAVVLWGEADLKQTLAQSVGPVALSIGETKRWLPNKSEPGTMQMDSTPDAAWRLRVTQGQGSDRWAYPLFMLPDNVHLEKASGLILRARCSAGASVRVLVWEGDANTNVVYLTPDPIIPGDGHWHVVRVPFHDLVPSTANAPDPDGHLDLSRVHRVSVGMNHHATECTLEVSDLYVVGGASADLRPK